VVLDLSFWDEDVQGRKFTSVYDVAGYLLEAVADLHPGSHTYKTPARFVKALRELTTPEEFEFTTFETDLQNLIVEKQIPVTSLCAHHILPYQGYVQIGYIPQGRIAGLSKLPRLVRNEGRKLSVQEELTRDIAVSLQTKLGTEHVAVVMECEHLCMTLRGIQVPGVTTYTAEMRGAFSDHQKTAKAEFMEAIRR
jgi:GTP cyclohydrolase I